MMNIALTGKNGVGKDTVADYLAKTYGYRKLAFADSLRDIARLNGEWALTEEDLGYDTAKRHPWFRHYLIDLGTTIRSYDPDFFVRALAKCLGIGGCQLRHGLIDPAQFKLLGAEEAERLKVIPMFKVGDTLTVAMAQPQSLPTIDRIQQITGCRVRAVLHPPARKARGTRPRSRRAS